MVKTSVKKKKCSTFIGIALNANTLNTNAFNVFFWHCLNTTACKFNESSNGTVNAIQRKLSICAK